MSGFGGKAEHRHAGLIQVDGADSLATGVRYGAVVLDASDDFPVIVAVTFGDSRADLQRPVARTTSDTLSSDKRIVVIPEALVVRIEAHRCTRGLGPKRQRGSPVVCITLSLTISKYGKKHSIKAMCYKLAVQAVCSETVSGVR